MHEQCGAWTAPLREQGTTAPKDGSAHCAKSCAWREGLWVGHGRAGDGLMSAFPASCFTQGTSRRMCAAVGVGGGALVQPPQPLRVEQCSWMILPLSRAEACHEYNSTTDVESRREFES